MVSEQNAIEHARWLFRLLAFAVVFGLILAVLAWLQPKHTDAILIVGRLLLIAVSASWFGWYWDGPTWRREVRPYVHIALEGLLVLLLIVLPGLEIMLAPAEVRPLVATDHATTSAVNAVTVLIPFLVARWLRRMREDRMVRS